MKFSPQTHRQYFKILMEFSRLFVSIRSFDNSVANSVATAAEGTATHEMSETSTTQKAESKAKTTHKKSSKKKK